MRRCVQAVWIAAVAGSGVAQPGTNIHPDVQQLLDREHRDAAMQRILQRGEYRGPGTYSEEAASQSVQHVVVCPQPKGLPLFAVFLETSWMKGDPHRARGHLITVAPDGAVVRCYLANNLVDGTFGDANGDGIVERIEVMRYGLKGGHSVSELFVLPITEEVAPTLRVAFDPNELEGASTYRVVPRTDDAPARVELGPKDPETGELAEVVATWEWRGRAWVGPGGGPDQQFMRLPPLGRDGLEVFVETRARKTAGR